jgi:hypothetical protein
MAEIKTKKTNASAEDFINSVDNETRRADGFTLLSLYKKITKQEPKMWGSSIIGFDQYHYKSERSTQEGDWPLAAFSPRKQNLTLYVINGTDAQAELLGKLGKFKTSKGCLYINNLSDVDMNVLEEVIDESYRHFKKVHSAN